MMIRESVTGIDPNRVSKALDYCLANKISSATDFKSILSIQETEKTGTKVVRLNPLSGNVAPGSQVQPDTSSIKDYESILKKQK